MSHQSTASGEHEYVSDVFMWLHSLKRNNPELGRKGAVCPYLGHSLALGRTSVSTVKVTGAQGYLHLKDAARSSLQRIDGESSESGVFNSFVIIPVGGSPEDRRDLVVRANRELKPQAVMAGKMVGEFYPKHDRQGIHSSEFRPLVSPHPVLAVRSMAVTDILFLTSPDILPEDQLAYLEIWSERFGEIAEDHWKSVFEIKRTEALGHLHG